MGAIGNMDRKIELKSLTSTKSSMGAPVKTYTHYKYLWASRTAASEQPENYVNNRLVIAPRYKYQVHYDSGIVENMKLIDSSVEYNILMVTGLNNLFIEILAEKIVE
jgi:SPP1 family predicted phage head-tail adaptor